MLEHLASGDTIPFQSGPDLQAALLGHASGVQGRTSSQGPRVEE
jgi:hypothetical protein